MRIAAGKFKAQCLALMDEVQKQHRAVTITKRGRPVAKLVPVGDEVATPVFGYLRGRVRFDGDIVAPTGEAWNADA